MELIYLKLLNANHLSEKGFNFSADIKLKYKDYALTEIPKSDTEKDEDIYNDFFGKNLSITAIVGENGSGKSTILQKIDELFSFELVNEIIQKLGKKESDFEKSINSFILCYRLGTQNYIYTNCEKLTYPPKFNKVNSIKNLASIKLLHNDNTIENEDDLLKLDDDESLLTFMLSEQNNMLPVRIKSIKFYISNDSYSRAFKKVYEIYQNNSTNINEDEVIEFIVKLDDKNFNSEDKRSIKRFKALNTLKNNNYYSSNKNKIIPIEHLDNEFIMNYHRYLNVEYYGDDQVSFKIFSHGEKTLLLLFAKIINEISESEDDNHLFLLDELDISLHPIWQKNYLNYLTNALNNFLLKMNYQKTISIILTTHSPFVLSDMPKSNVIFLKNGVQVDGLEHQQTFGTNIHTLLSDSFFMGDSLMGEFAKTKIEKIIKFCNDMKALYGNDKNHKFSIEDKDQLLKFKKLHKIIGDEYISNIIGNHLEEIEKIILGNNYKEYELKQLINLLGVDKVKEFLGQIND